MIMGESASTLAPWVTGVCCFEAIWLYQGATVPSFEPPEEEEAHFLGGLQGGPERRGWFFDPTKIQCFQYLVDEFHQSCLIL